MTLEDNGMTLEDDGMTLVFLTTSQVNKKMSEMSVEEFRRLYDSDHSVYLKYNGELLDAVLENRIDDVRRLLDMGVPAWADGSYAARKAADRGYVEITHLLMNGGANCPVRYSYSFLRSAINAGQFYLAQHIFEECKSKNDLMLNVINTDNSHVMEFVANICRADHSEYMKRIINSRAIKVLDVVLRTGVVPTDDDWRMCLYGWVGNDEGLVRLFLSHGFFDKRVDVYRYVSYLIEEHLQHIPDSLRKIVEWRCGMRKRMMRSPADVVILSP